MPIRYFERAGRVVVRRGEAVGRAHSSAAGGLLFPANLLQPLAGVPNHAGIGKVPIDQIENLPSLGWRGQLPEALAGNGRRRRAIPRARFSPRPDIGGASANRSCSGSLEIVAWLETLDQWARRLELNGRS